MSNRKNYIIQLKEKDKNFAELLRKNPGIIQFVSERTEKIVLLRLGMDDYHKLPHAFNKIGEEFGITGQRASQIYNNTMSELIGETHEELCTIRNIGANRTYGMEGKGLELNLNEDEDMDDYDYDYDYDDDVDVELIDIDLEE